MRHLIWLFLIQLCVVSASYSIFIKDSIGEGQVKYYSTDNGAYIVELVGVYSSTAKFKINGQALNSLHEGEGDTLSDKSELIVKKIYPDHNVDFFFFGSGDLPIRADVDSGWDPLDCNFDKICQEGETQSLCCHDCGCDQELVCENNQCIEKGCRSDKECMDTNPCTSDFCYNSTCWYEKKAGCPFNDNCVDIGKAIKEDNISYRCASNGWIKLLTADSQKPEISKKDKSLARFLTVILLAAIIIMIAYSAKKNNFVKKIKKKLFWKF